MYSVFGQLDDQSYLNEYKKAVQLFANSQFDEAGAKFSPLCSKTYHNPVVPYAYFYQALSAKNKGNAYQSRVLFRQLFDGFYDWDKIDVARLIYAELNFSENYYEEALKSLDRIDKSTFAEVKQGMLISYIPKIQSLSSLKDLYYKFPSEEIIAVNLVKKIQANRYNSKEDLQLSDMLTNRFKLKEGEKTKIEEVKPPLERKALGPLVFSVLLPFNVLDSKPISNQSDYKYTYDLYAGMKLAQEELAKENIAIVLKAFDIQKSKADFSKFERKGEFKDADFFIGPLYPEPNALASDYAFLNKVTQIHPLSNNLGLLKVGRNVFLGQPSFDMQAQKALLFTEHNAFAKTVSIYFGSTKKDSLFATIYKSEALKKGYKINHFGKYAGSNVAIAKETGHIFFALDNNLGAKFLQNMFRDRNTSKVMASAGSFNWNNITKSIFTENVHVIYPEFVDMRKEKVIAFKKSYENLMFSLPSYYSFAGYDIVMHFAKMMKDGKDIFKLNIDAGSYVDEYMLSGFDFTGKRYENAIVPIVKLNEEEFEEIYR
jgi:ABC-type branched-subunit amino acid transport system substrate-binding protein